jgi:hypothetical protein
LHSLALATRRSCPFDFAWQPLITTTAAERALTSVVAYETLAAPASTATATRAIRTARRRTFKSDIGILPLVRAPEPQRLPPEFS